MVLAAVMVLVASNCLAGQALRLGNGSEPETLDPQLAESVSALNIVRDLYEGLTTIGSDGEPAPAAAESWLIADGGRKYVFRLRSGLRWSDGHAVVAEDFVAGFRRALDPATGASNSKLLSAIRGAEAVRSGQGPATLLAVRAISPQLLQIELTHPQPYFLHLLSHPVSFPVPCCGAIGAKGSLSTSNGAYRLVHWQPQDRVVLERNIHYREAAQVQIERVEYFPSESATNELNRYRVDELDITYEVPLARAPWLRNSLAREFRVSGYLGTYFYGFNCSRPPFKDNPKLRRALTLAVDRRVIVDKVMNGLALPAYSLLPPGLSGYTPQRPEWADWSRERRLAEARRLYAEAGYSAQRPLVVELRYNTHEDHKRIATVVAAMWKQWLGVRTTLLNEEFKVFIQNRNLRKITQLFRAVWIADYDDPTAFTDILHSSHGQNDMAYNNPDYDRLLALAAAEADSERRRQHLAQAEQLLLRDQPLLPIYTYTSKHLVKPWVQGWTDNPLDIHYSKDLRIVGRPAEAAR